jgi:hypothetical protein
MQRERALEILKALADGVDHTTGEQLPVGSLYQHPDTVRALYCAIQIMENAPAPRQPAAPRERSSARLNAGRPWTEEEEARLAQAFDAGTPIEALSQAHQRSRWAIEARLARLGKIPEPQNTRFPIRRPAAAQAPAVYSAR